MKRPVFIIIGAVIVFILLSVWVYLFFFNTPKNGANDEFTDLNLTDTTDTTVTEFETEDALIDVFSPEALRQLTTLKTIGFQEVIKDASSSPEVYYAEAGTGNIFSINLETGEETRISKTTIPESRKVAITKNGEFVLFQSGTGLNSEFYLGTLSTSSDEISLDDLPSNIISFTETNDNTFLLAVQNVDSVTAQEYYPKTKKTANLFTIPFREVSIDWGETGKDTHYFYPKASKELEGYLYSVNNNKIKRLPISEYGLSAIGNNNYIITGGLNNGNYSTDSFTIVDGSSQLLPLTLLPEKCDFVSLESFETICAVNTNDNIRDLPDSWYQGLMSSVDSLWKFNLITNVATLIINTNFETGREIDIIDIDLGEKGVYFINKNDSTLWLFDENIPINTEV